MHSKRLEKLVKEINFTAADGVELNGWYVPAQGNKPTVVFAHGNGGNIGDRYNIVSMFNSHGYGILAFDYRGYGKSKGYASEKGLYQDFEAASRFLTRQYQIPVSNQIALGESLGTAVAIDGASRQPYRAVLVYSCMTTAPDVAEHLRDTNQMGWLRFLPPRQIMRQYYDALSKVHKIKSPILFVQGEKDQMMPVWMAEKLYAQSTARHKKLLIIPGAGHNTVMDYGSEQVMKSFNALMAESEPQASLADSSH